MKYFIAILISIFSISSHLQASDLNLKDSLTDNSSYWLGLGIGSNYFGPHFCANLSLTIDHNLFTLKYAKSNEFIIGSENVFDDPSLEIKEYAFLYGRTFRKNILLFSVSGGVSYVKGINRGKNISNHQYENINISTFGFPFEAEAMFEFTNYIGAGILFYGNINKDKIFGGAMLRIKFGWF